MWLHMRTSWGTSHACPGTILISVDLVISGLRTSFIKFSQNVLRKKKIQKYMEYVTIDHVKHVEILCGR